MTRIAYPSTVTGRIRFGSVLLLGAILVIAAFRTIPPAEPGAAWKRHMIDDSLDGADGTRLGDVNRDGLPDVVTGWEQSGTVRVALNPGPLKSREPWRAVTVGAAPDVEDAIAVDVDDDGAPDILSSSEGSTRTLSVHWAPRDASSVSTPEAWRTDTIPASTGKRWMFALPLDLGGRDGLAFVAGSKGDAAGITLFRPGQDPHDLGAWRGTELYRGGWIMSLVGRDLDGDGDTDIIASDRRGPHRGVLWLENPGGAGETWTEHRIGPVDQFEVMFLDLADLDGDGLEDIVAETRNGEIHAFRRESGPQPSWTESIIPGPNPAATGKSVAVGDIDCDGLNDLVVSHEGARGSAGVMGLYQRRTSGGTAWVPFAVSDNLGIKFDLVVLVDLDADGDLDVLTSEEKTLGVVWYENPGAPATAEGGTCAPGKDVASGARSRADRG